MINDFILKEKKLLSFNERSELSISTYIEICELISNGKIIWRI